MIVPIRCFTCGKVIGDKWEPFVRRVDAGETPKDVLDDLDLFRYCCRRMILSHVEIFDEILNFSKKNRSFDLLTEVEKGMTNNVQRY